MTPKEEKSLTFRRQARYFFCVLIVYICVYTVLYLALSLIHAIIYLSPYLRMVMLVLFFIASSVITNRVMQLPSVRAFIEIQPFR